MDDINHKLKSLDSQINTLTITMGDRYDELYSQLLKKQKTNKLYNELYKKTLLRYLIAVGDSKKDRNLGISKLKREKAF